MPYLYDRNLKDFLNAIKHPSCRLSNLRRPLGKGGVAGSIPGGDIYTRQNKLRVTSRSKQCNSFFFNKMHGLIPILDCYNNLPDDILGSNEEFSVKIFFSKSLIFEILKILIFNPKSLNFYSL